MSSATSSQPFAVQIIAPGVVYATASVALMRMDVARPLCDALTAASTNERATGLVMDLKAISKATPAAGYFGMQQIRHLPFRRIGFVGGNRFMRAFASVVLTLARFPAFAFFDTQAAALQWVTAAI